MTRIQSIFRKDPAWGRNLAWHLAPPLLFLLGMFFFFPFRGRFTFDPDEGLNLMKAMLVVKGHPLYHEIWSDQPPLFTHLLGVVFRLFGFEVSFGRLTVLLLSSLLFWGFTQFLRLVWGDRHALIGAILLLVLPTYQYLSVSAMVGLPALTFAMLSMLFLVYWHHFRLDRWLVLSAIAFSLSIMTKLFTGFLAPIFVSGLFIEEFTRLRKEVAWKRFFYPGGIWTLVFASTSLVLGLVLVGPSNVSQLITSHIEASTLDLFQAEIFTLSFHLRDAYPVLVTSLFGVVYTLINRRWFGLYPVVWMGSAFFLLSRHRPVWDHQQLLVTLPAALLAAGAVGEALNDILNQFRKEVVFQRRSFLAFLSILGLIMILVLQTPVLVQKIYRSPTLKPTSSESRFLVWMYQFAPNTQWVITDRPMFPFRVGLPVPPEVAVISAKRFLTGSLSENQILEILQNYNPEQVLLGRFEYPALEKTLGKNYQIVYTRLDSRLFIRTDLVKVWCERVEVEGVDKVLQNMDLSFCIE